MGMFERMLGNLMGGRFGGYNGCYKGGHVTAATAMVVIQAIRRVAVILAIPAPNGAARMRGIRTFASNAAFLWRLVNASATVSSCQHALGFVANAERRRVMTGLSSLDAAIPVLG